MRLRIVCLLVLSLNAMAQSLAPIENDPRAEDRKALLKSFSEVEASINEQSLDRILNKYTTKAAIHGHARFLGNGDVAVADGTMEDEFTPVIRGPFRLSGKWTTTISPPTSLITSSSTKPNPPSFTPAAAPLSPALCSDGSSVAANK